MQLPKLHYIAMSGNRGCIPDYCQAFDNRGDAIASLIQLFELSPRGKHVANLKTYGYTSFEKGIEYGAEYAEIIKCSCANKNIHNGDE